MFPPRCTRATRLGSTPRQGALDQLRHRIGSATRSLGGAASVKCWRCTKAVASAEARCAPSLRARARVRHHVVISSDLSAAAGVVPSSTLLTKVCGGARLWISGSSGWRAVRRVLPGVIVFISNPGSAAPPPRPPPARSPSLNSNISLHNEFLRQRRLQERRRGAWQEGV